MKAKFSREIKEVISLSREEALRLDSNCITAGHLFLGMIPDHKAKTINLLKEYLLRDNLPANADPKPERMDLNSVLQSLRQSVEQAITASTTKEGLPEASHASVRVHLKFGGSTQRAAMPLSGEAERVLKNSDLEARQHKSPIIQAEHLLLALLSEQESEIARLLNTYQLSYQGYRDTLVPQEIKKRGWRPWK